MKQTIFIMFLFVCSSLFGQEADSVDVITTYYWKNGKKVWSSDTTRYKITNNKEESDSIHYYFTMADSLLQGFVDIRYKSEQVITKSCGPDTSKWEACSRNIYDYDSLSRVIRFHNTSCMYCSYLSYTYEVNYNNDNQVMCVTGIDGTQNSREYFYDNKGRVIEKRFYLGNELEQKIVIRKVASTPKKGASTPKKKDSYEWDTLLY